MVVLNDTTGLLIWYATLQEEVRATCAAADGHIYVGVDTGHKFFKLHSQSGETLDEFALTYGNYFVGSAGLSSSSADLVYMGNDNGNFYVLRQSSITIPMTSHYTGGIVCSSPSISYAAELNARWVYILSRGDNNRGDGVGTLFAFRQQR